LILNFAEQRYESFSVARLRSFNKSRLHHRRSSSPAPSQTLMSNKRLQSP
jgi:hypothetical protein